MLCELTGTYTISMTENGDTKQWCPGCKEYHAKAGGIKPSEQSSKEKDEGLHNL